MTQHPAPLPEADAVEAPPWDPAKRPGPAIRSYGTQRPRMRIRIDGVWRDAQVIQRQDWPDGRIRMLCDVYLPSEVGWVWLVRGYWWDSAAMRPA
ncbi:hypothetical protein [Streptomyces sp. NPDC088733]|uniref:hypothetical protein n=1 Tax=Streptomyces sp. NPDC088733 TaxID=3365880 RepID=UPI0038093A20